MCLVMARDVQSARHSRRIYSRRRRQRQTCTNMRCKHGLLSTAHAGSKHALTSKLHQESDGCDGHFFVQGKAKQEVVQELEEAEQGARK